MYYSPKFFSNVGYAQQRLRKHGELFAFELLEECVREIQQARRSALASDRAECRDGRCEVFDSDCRFELRGDDVPSLGDDSSTSERST